MAETKVVKSGTRTKRGGRKAGTPNKVTAQIKDAIITAAEKYGQDGKGKDKMVGYMMRLAGEQPVAFAGLLGKVLPTQVAGTGDDGEPTSITIHYVSPGS